MPVDPSVFESIKAFYGMSADFEQGNFFGRSSIARKVRTVPSRHCNSELGLTNGGVMQVYFLNEGVAQIVNNPLNHKLKVCCRSSL